MSENKPPVHVENDEKHLLLDHNYDGIHELNHPLPMWWQITFYGGIIFAIIYFIYYIVLSGPTLRDEFKNDFLKIQEQQALFAQKNATFDPIKYAAIVSDDGIKKGEEVFINNCVPCHLEKGIGDIGPNLTDEYWLRAKGTPDTIYHIVYNGSVDNGMPIWSETLTPEEIYQVTSYVMTLHHLKLKGKEAQGEKVE
jgi:cytochrome c oxidase cbb3-type subunit 3